MIRKHVFKGKSRNDSIRWRLHEPTRLEAFSDAVMAFAMTLIVVSLEVPKTFEALLVLMRGFYGFALCFTLLVLIWHDQYIFFRRYGLQDARTTFYNLVLLFMVIYFVYPLKFLFYALTEGNITHLENGDTVEKFTEGRQVCQLMIIYGIGYFIIYFIMILMYFHALKRRKDLLLSRLEVYNTKTHIMTYYGRLAVVVLSLSLATFGLSHGDIFSLYAGLSYTLFGFVIGIIKMRRRKKIKRLFSQEEIDEVKNEIIVIEERN